MLLQTVQIKKFKCIKDSNEFKIDPKVTCLVGKNESGKTALLQALSKINPSDSRDPGLDDLDYPRHLYMGLEEDENAKLEVVITKWKFSDSDFQSLCEMFGPSAQHMGQVIVTRGYDNKNRYVFENEIKEQDVVLFLIQKHGLMEDEKRLLGEEHTFEAVIQKLRALEDPTKRLQGFYSEISNTYSKNTLHDVVCSFIEEQLLPKVAYLSEYMRMPGQISLSDLKSRMANDRVDDKHRVFLALLSLLGKEISDLEKTNEFERLQAELESASNRLTREIFRFWSQNKHLKVQFRFERGLPGDPPPFNDGYVLRTRIENTRYGVTTSFDQRSEGFVWFFSFLVWFNQLKKNYGDNLVLLLDEPGLKLHAKAQQDLLRYIEVRLAPKYQVVYTTHSPFMIDPKNLLRTRTVEDIFLEEEGDEFIEEPDLGTKVGDDVLSTDRDTVFPLQACLGYEITQTLFIGQHTLLVEGPSDLLYLQWFQRRLVEEGRTSLDHRWTIVPCGGVDKVAAFLSLFAGNQLHVAIFTDFAKGDKRKVQRLRESQLLREGHVFTADQYTDGVEADIEDLLGEQAYINLVNKCMSLKDGLEISFLTEGGDKSKRLVKRVEEYCRTLPPEVDTFHHYKPAEFLFQRGVHSELDGLELALNRFENLFTDLNALIE